MVLSMFPSVCDFLLLFSILIASGLSPRYTAAVDMTDLMFA